MILYALIYFDLFIVDATETLVLKAMTKVEINFCKCGLFLIFNMDYFCHLGRANSIKTAL